MAVGKGFFDQYSVFCVFGSVVGCVVVPLITQSVECVIFSAIVISLTAASHLNKKSSTSDSSTKSSPAKDNEKRKHKESHGNSSCKKKLKEPQHIIHQDKEYVLRKQQEQFRKDEQQKIIDMEKRLEEKRTKKAKKREERLRKKESETKEKHELEEKIKSVQEKRLKQHKDEVKKNSKGASVSALDRFCQDEPEYMQLRRRSVCDENKRIGFRIPRLERPRLHSHPISSCQKKSTTKTSDVFLPVKISPLSLSSSSLSSIGSNHDQECPSAPPSVWKLPPQGIQPEWKPGKPDWSSDVHNKSLLCKSVSDGEKYNRYQGSQNGFRLTTSDHVPGLDRLLKETTNHNQSLFSAQQGSRHCTLNDNQFGEYSLFGPNELDRVLFKQSVM